jgi:hypothetical protein
VQRRPAAGRGAGSARGGRRERGVGRTEGQAHGRMGWGAEGGVCRGKCVAFLRIKGKDAYQKKRSLVIFWIPGEATVEKIKLTIEAFGGIFAFF